MEEFDDVRNLRRKRLLRHEHLHAPLEVLLLPGRVTFSEETDTLLVLGVLFQGGVEAGAHVDFFRLNQVQEMMRNLTQRGTLGSAILPSGRRTTTW